jgi:hypothetical protein
MPPANHVFDRRCDRALKGPAQGSSRRHDSLNGGAWGFPTAILDRHSCRVVTHPQNSVASVAGDHFSNLQEALNGQRDFTLPINERLDRAS